MIVVDCTVIADFWVGESTNQEAAHDLWKLDSHWIAPDLWRYEFGNVLLKYVRAGRISKQAMKGYLTEGQELVGESVGSLNLNEVAELCLQREISFYDASYVRLAQVRGLPLYTRDGKLMAKCPDVARLLS